MFWNKKEKAVEKPVLDQIDEKAEQIKQLTRRVNELKNEKLKLTENIEEMKFKKRLEQEEIVHLQKLNEGRMKQELEQEKVNLQKKYADDISMFKEEQRKTLVESLEKFHTKMESRFSDELKNLKEVYSMLMEKLPNVNFAITKEISDRPRDTGTDRPVIEATGSTKHKR